MVSIRGYGSYVPLYRIERTTIAAQYNDRAGSGDVTVPAHDENVVTLGVNAAETALDHAGNPPVEAVYVTSISDPFDERGIAPHIATAITTPNEVRVADFQGSARAATNALLAAIDAIEAGRIETAVVVATDTLSAAPGSNAEQTLGAGAGAIVLSNDGDIGSITDTAVNTTGFIGQFTPARATRVEGDGRFNRKRYIEAVTGAINHLSTDSLPPAHAVLPATDGRWGSRALETMEYDPTLHSTFQDAGCIGTASVLIDTALALEHADENQTILIASYGPGGSDAITITTDTGVDRLPTMTTQDYIESKEYIPYGKHREYRDHALGEA